MLENRCGTARKVALESGQNQTLLCGKTNSDKTALILKILMSKRISVAFKTVFSDTL